MRSWTLLTHFFVLLSYGNPLTALRNIRYPSKLWIAADFTAAPVFFAAWVPALTANVFPIISIYSCKAAVWTCFQVKPTTSFVMNIPKSKLSLCLIWMLRQSAENPQANSQRNVRLDLMMRVAILGTRMFQACCPLQELNWNYGKTNLPSSRYFKRQKMGGLKSAAWYSWNYCGYEYRGQLMDAITRARRRMSQQSKTHVLSLIIWLMLIDRAISSILRGGATTIPCLKRLKRADEELRIRSPKYV